MITDCYSTTIRATTRKITAMYDDALAPAGITIAQLALLRRLSADSPLSVDALAKSAELERSTVARNIRVLQSLALVEIGQSTTDRRAAAILLTARGVETRLKSEPLWDGAQRRFEERFGRERAEALRDLCRQFELVQADSA
ncbi:MarR family winged helix-turn-helix transcriptional regulator [Lacisediminihabitans sp.]|uniref:MarR family winged helix-turn-helix transcriptional regulator n=1 Tax=Lacisediminihabitans sp. TaxID=2787631 RepID=UPI00374CAA27